MKYDKGIMMGRSAINLINTIGVDSKRFRKGFKAFQKVYRITASDLHDMLGNVLMRRGKFFKMSDDHVTNIIMNVSIHRDHFNVYDDTATIIDRVDKFVFMATLFKKGGFMYDKY